jgi:methyl-accepting chemotaxis protein
MKHLSVQKQLTIAFGALVALVVLVSGFAVQGLSSLNTKFANYVAGEARREGLAVNILNAANQRAVAVRDMVLVKTTAERTTQQAAAVKAHEALQSTLKALKDEVRAGRSDVGERDRTLVAAIDKVEAAYSPVALAIVQLAAADRREEAIDKMNIECRPLLAELVATSSAYLDYTHDQAIAKVDAAAAAYATQRSLLLTVSGLTIALAVVLGWQITRRLLAALGAEPAELSRAARRVAEGDLGPVRGADTARPGSVLASMGAMQAQLVGLIRQVRGAADSIATASVEIAQGNVDLSSRTEQQAAALQQTASTMEELGTTVRRNADNASQANQLAQGASKVAVKGGAVVSEVVTTMKGINDGSRKISEIISVIDGIAFQTNILALNAAVEAARAGEQGRGFAVVAGEVRSLAQRSAEAARQIKTLITSSVEQVAQGTMLVDQAGQTMDEIVGAIQRVSDIVREISSASAEQSQGVGQVGEAVSQMDQVTQQNAALVEESAAAAASLRDQARQLVETVAMFRLDTRAAQRPSTTGNALALPYA